MVILGYSAARPFFTKLLNMVELSVQFTKISNEHLNKTITKHSIRVLKTF